ncbi:MAG: adenosylmethionine--8-amino-7-oxononanoate transaminase [Polyangiaceae bacterium]|nr:adenosylmethionine--8-amino-7-oxononanoate transaminase [Polyangiaceae bacterium]
MRDTRAEILRLDRAHVWHPYTPMDAWETADPIVVARAAGAWLEDVDGRRYLDGNASWWSQALGHGHPRLLRALANQAQVLAHCALGGIAHEPAARLAEELVAIAPRGLRRVFYVDNGSCAIDAAAKMAVQGWRQLGAAGKTRFVALDGAFHGDTVGATSLGGVDVFRRLYAGVTFDCVHAPFPETGAYERAVETIGRILDDGGGTVAAVFVEPMCQGAAGMRTYDASALRELRALCDRFDAWLVADEVFTGYGRTGPMWACEHAGITPDLMCIGKVFSQIIPMGAVLASDRVFDAFRGGRDRAFLHGHTFCGNPLGAALAREVLAIYRDERVLDQVARKSGIIARAFDRIRELPGVERVRTIGMIGAADLADGAGRGGYLGGLGWRVYDEARKRGAYLRPLGNTVYVAPPLTIGDADLRSLLAILDESITVTASNR